MKTGIKKLLLLPALITGLGLILAGRVTGQTFTTLYSFTATTLDSDTNSSRYSASTNSDGASPSAGLILSGNTLYGTASHGGTSDYGTVFAVNTDGTGFTTLYSFTFYDGAYPHAGLILSSNTFYGTTGYGGSSWYYGTVFAINTDGTGFTTVHSFTAPDQTYGTNSDGAYPYAALMLSGNILYGTASSGGRSGSGTVFAINTDGTGFTTLHNFTRHGGAGPDAGLILTDNTLYGTAAGGGSSDAGTVFSVSTAGMGFTTLYSFTASSTNASGVYTYTNSDGIDPSSVLVLSGNTLYGTAREGGSSGNGTVFSLSLPVTPPQLTITSSGAYVILTWPTNATGYNLQSTTNLVSPAVWTGVSPGPAVVNGQNAVTNPISGTQQFFRLSQ